MNNSEIRIKALAKAKDYNFSAAGAFTYFIMGIVLLAGDVTGIYIADIAISAAVAFIASLICGPGYVHVAMETWRQGKKNFSGLFFGFRNFSRAAFPAAIYATMLLVFRFLVLGRKWYVALIFGIVALALNLVATWAAYGAELSRNENGPISAADGIMCLFKNIGRAVEMRAYVYWWIAAFMGAVLWICDASGLHAILTALVVFLSGLVCRWMVGAFNALCEAGLARNLMK